MDSPLEKKVVRPIHSVAGGEFGGADDEGVGVGLYRVPFQTTNFPKTVSNDSRRVVCRLLAPPRLLNEPLLEHSSAVSISVDDEGKFKTI